MTVLLNLYLGVEEIYPTLRYRTETIKPAAVNGLVGVEKSPSEIATLLSKVKTLHPFLKKC